MVGSCDGGFQERKRYRGVLYIEKIPNNKKCSLTNWKIQKIIWNFDLCTSLFPGFNQLLFDFIWIEINSLRQQYSKSNLISFSKATFTSRNSEFMFAVPTFWGINELFTTFVRKIIRSPERQTDKKILLKNRHKMLRIQEIKRQKTEKNGCKKLVLFSLATFLQSNPNRAQQSRYIKELKANFYIESPAQNCDRSATEKRNIDNDRFSLLHRRRLWFFKWFYFSTLGWPLDNSVDKRKTCFAFFVTSVGWRWLRAWSRKSQDLLIWNPDRFAQRRENEGKIKTSEYDSINAD